MTNKLFKISIIMVLIFSSCSKEDAIKTTEEEVITIDVTQKEPLSAEQVKSKIDESLNSTGSFNWNQASSHLLWSAANQGQNVITIGFGNLVSDFDRSQSDNSAKMQNELLDIILKYKGTSLNKILVSADEYLNLIDVVVSKQETIITLRKYANLRYIEPADYRYFGTDATRNGQPWVLPDADLIQQH